MALYLNAAMFVLCAFVCTWVGPSVSNISDTAQGGQGDSSKPQSKKLPSFWIPSLTPDAKPVEIKKPVSR